MMAESRLRVEAYLCEVSNGFHVVSGLHHTRVEVQHQLYLQLHTWTHTQV